MAIFGVNPFDQIQHLKSNKRITVALHSFMLFLCMIGSFIFIQDIIDSSNQMAQDQSFFTIWSSDSISFFLGYLIEFIKIKIIVPAFILGYFYYCIKQKVFQKLLKDEYIQKYNKRYNKIHKIEHNQHKKISKEVSIVPQSEESQQNLSQTRREMMSKQAESSLNMSMQMVKSMSRSMMGSLKSIGGQNLSQSMIDRGNLSMRSSKVIQNVVKKGIEVPKGQVSHGKDLMSLFDKGKNLSESFLSQSSSGIEGEDMKIKIKSKKYYEFINQRQGLEFKKWYDEANSKYIQHLKSQSKDNKTLYVQLMQLKKGLEREFNAFLREYRENTEAVKECLLRFWNLRIEGFQSKKPLKTGYELSSLFKEEGKITAELPKRNSQGVSVSETLIFQKASSPLEFIRHINQLKVPLKNNKEKTIAEKELSSILSKRRYLNTLLNISSIQGELFSPLEAKKIKSLEKSLQILSSDKIFSFNRSDTEFSELDLFEEYDIETIKQLIELRVNMLVYVVNKINLMSNQRQFKVKMNAAVTYDSGYLATALNFFKNQNFAEITCDKGVDNIFPHFNLKIFRRALGQEGQKQNVVYCKPGIDNSISVLLFLVKGISEYLSESYRFEQRLSYDEKRREQEFRQFIQSFYVNRRF